MCSLLVPWLVRVSKYAAGFDCGTSARGYGNYVHGYDTAGNRIIYQPLRNTPLPPPAADLCLLSGRSACCSSACSFPTSVLTIRLRLVFAVFTRRLGSVFLLINIYRVTINASSSRCLAETRVRSRANPCGIYAERNGSGTDF